MSDNWILPGATIDTSSVHLTQEEFDALPDVEELVIKIEGDDNVG